MVAPDEEGVDDLDQEKNVNDHVKLEKAAHMEERGRSAREREVHAAAKRLCMSTVRRHGKSARKMDPSRTARRGLGGGARALYARVSVKVKSNNEGRNDGGIAQHDRHNPSDHPGIGERLVRRCRGATGPRLGSALLLGSSVQDWGEIRVWGK